MSPSRFSVCLPALLLLLQACPGPIAMQAASAKKAGQAECSRTKISTEKGKDESADSEEDESTESDKTKSNKENDKKDNENKKKGKEDGDEPKLSVSEHTIVIDGKPVKYKATAGFMVLKDFNANKSEHDGKGEEKDKDRDKEKKKDAKALAKVFFIAYTREDAGSAAKRPLTFSFNGGPGSASIWLHMGGLGPRRAVLSESGEALPPPYKLEDNPYSWIDISDVVFIDPVSTGYSRPEPGEDAKKFHGYTEDIESVGEFIRLYVTKNQRWASPKFIVGESYGTTRAAGLSEFLQKRYGLYLNGIALVSTVLNFATIEFDSGNDIPNALFLPSYAATAWYHKKLPPETQNRSLSDLLKEVEEFASQEYLQALFMGDRLSAQKKEELSNKLSSYTGLPARYVKQLNNRIEDHLFFTHLLSDENRLLGRYDSRFTGIRYSPGTDHYEFDPSGEAVTGTFTAAFNDYVRRELKFENEMPYETVANVRPWSFRNAQNRYLNVSEDLRKAMSRNPYLKVWLACGHYDLATPYFASKYTVDQMALDPAIAGNVRLSYYDSGHMMYIYKPALKQFKADFASFLKDSILPDSQAVKNAQP